MNTRLSSAINKKKNNAANKIQKNYRKHNNKLYTDLVNEVYDLYENNNIKPINTDVLNVIRKCYIRLRKDDLNDLYFKEFLDNLYLYYTENNNNGSENQGGNNDGYETDDESNLYMRLIERNNYLKFLVENISEKYLVALLKRAGIKELTVDNYKTNEDVKEFLSDVVEEVPLECFSIDYIRTNSFPINV
jgi:hypothetical protein